jgi:hypothetical protein
MSGGHFNYEQWKINSIADDIEDLIFHNGNQDKNQYGDRIHQEYSPETIEEFKNGLELMRKAYVYAQRIDWLVSGDDGEDSFHIRLKHDLDKL